MSTRPYILYGMPASLYTGKVRAYLRRRGLPFTERPVGHPRFMKEIAPMVGRFIMPVVETPEGALLQDGTAILDALEAEHPGARPILPRDPVLRALSHLFELFGGEGLLRPAMHYRWDFDEENLDFLRADFAAALAPHASPEEGAAVFDGASGRMRWAKAAFGVNEETAPMVERSYLEFLDLFSAHLEESPYLLGVHATAGDYALFGPLGPHLARDPHPSALMKRRAPKVFRWTERMAAPEGDEGDGLVSAADLPASLKALLAFVAEDHLPEVEAHVRFANAWLAERPELPAGEHGIEKPPHRAIGTARFAWRGTELDVAVMPYRLWLLQRLQDCAEGMDEADRARLDALFEETGLSPLLHLKTARRVERRGFLEVWGPKG